MTVLVQGAPLTGSVIPTESNVFQDQLTVLDSTPPFFFDTTVPSSAFTVSPTGLVTSAGFLLLGAYSASGIITDTHGNSGPWAYGLNVILEPVPQAVLTPLVAELPTGSEIALPFQFDATTGALAYLSNYVDILAQHIETIVLTAVGERIMIPTFGSRVEKALFAPLGSPIMQVMAADLSAEIQQWEPAVNVLSVTVNSTSGQQQDTGILLITVAFAVAPFNKVNTITISTGGSVQQVVAP
jgi:phage baseplate assembly protein W